MKRTPPSSGRGSYNSITFYAFEKTCGNVICTYVGRRLKREEFGLKSMSGKFVRYDNHFYRLREPESFLGTCAEILSNGDQIYDEKRNSLTLESKLKFPLILDDDRTFGLYA